LITTYDGGEFIGYILFQDSREVLIKTKDRGEISVPKYQIKEMREVKEGEISPKGEYIPPEAFSTRYFITTNGLPIENRESYILWNLWGPDFEFGVSKDFGVGVMTSWWGVPAIGSAKYSFKLGKDVNMALGTLLGWGTWAAPEVVILLPYAALTFGNRRNNLTFSGGYGLVSTANGRVLVSVAGMTKVSRSTSIVLDSFIIPAMSGREGGALIIPGIRVQTQKNRTFQFGFGGLVVEGEFFPAPFIQLFTKL
jgi:hypothetical protein